MKRLIVTGLPCPPEAWENFLKSADDGEFLQEQKIISLFEILEKSSTCDVKTLSLWVTDLIEDFNPDSILCHDFGVPLTFLSLLRLNRRGRCQHTRVTVFNGGFRNFNVFKTRHPLLAIYKSYKKFVVAIEREHGQVDPRLKAHFPRVKAIYRKIMILSLVERASFLLGLEEILTFRNRLPLKNPIQMIASRNDPYVNYESITQMKQDFSPRRYVEVEYGHFPYSISPENILPLVQAFERGTGELN